MAPQTETEKQVSKIFSDCLGDQLTSAHTIEDIKIVPVKTEDFTQNTIIVKLPIPTVTLLKRNYSKILGELKSKVFRNTEIYFLRNIEFSKAVKRGIIEDIAFPAEVSGSTEQHSNRGETVIKKTFVRPFNNFVDKERLSTMESVYRTVADEEMRFLLSNY